MPRLELRCLQASASSVQDLAVSAPTHEHQEGLIAAIGTAFVRQEEYPVVELAGPAALAVEEEEQVVVEPSVLVLRLEAVVVVVLEVAGLVVQAVVVDFVDFVDFAVSVDLLCRENFEPCQAHQHRYRNPEVQYRIVPGTRAHSVPGRRFADYH